MLSRLSRVIDDGEDIVRLGTGLLRLCRAELRELEELDGDPGIWSDREELRQRCEEFFYEVDDEELDPEERSLLDEIAASYSQKLPVVVIAHTMAEALDRVLGSRILPMFLGCDSELAPGEPVPVPHPDWRRFANAADPDGFHSDEDDEPDTPLDALPHLRIAGPWARDVQVTVDGDWRRWHTLPQLSGGDRLACATPNQSLAELTMDRTTVAGQPAFTNARFGTGDAAQCDAALSLLATAHDHDCRIVAFPEFSVPEEIRPAVARWLHEQDTVDLVVAGSCHVEDDDGGRYNEGVVFIRGVDQPMTHRKFSSGTVPDPDRPTTVLREHLSVGEPGFRVHLSTHWSLVLLVGSDAVQPRIAPAIIGLGANLILVPALAFQLDAYAELAAQVAKHAQGITLIANACVPPGPEQVRPPLVVGVPQRAGTVVSEACPPHSLLVITIGSLSQKPSIVAMDTES